MGATAPVVPSLVLALGDPRAADAHLVGPKAAHLSSLARAWPVPDGFCLTADAYRTAAAAGGPTPEIREAVHRAYTHLVGEAASPPSVAVRSSALDEDGPTTSFAGQHETILDVIGVDAVMTAIERTWSSLHTPAALAYRRAHGLPLDGLALAVLVQRLVPADRSGVAFSVDPVSGRSDRIVVNASWGLGESMVAGTVTPDTWHLDKATLAVLDDRLATKERMTLADGGGTREVAVPGFLQAVASLDGAMLDQVGALARDLEDAKGWPVDVEFAFEGERLYLLQCRPVTTRAAETGRPAAGPELPDPWREPGDAERFWERDRMHFPDQLTVLDDAHVQVVIDHGVNHGSRYYGLPFRSATRRFWTYHYFEDRPCASPTDADERAARMRAALAGLETSWSERWSPAIDEALTLWSTFDLPGASLERLIDHLDATWQRLRALWEIHFEIVMPLGRAKGLFTELYDEIFEPDGRLRAHELLRGIDTLTTEAGRRLWALRDVVTSVPGAAEVITSLPPAEVVPALERRPEMRTVADAIRDYLARYGQRTPTLGLSVPTLAEDPSPVMKMLGEAIAHPATDLDRRHTELAEERERRTREARAALARYPAPVRAEFDRRLAVARTAARLGEDHNYLIDFRSTAEARRVFLELGRRLADAGVLDAPDDVVHLTPDEVRETAVRLPDLDRRALVRERRAELDRYAAIDPPEAVGTRPEGAATPAATSDATRRRVARDGILTGTPGSSGVVRGRVRVLATLADAERLQPGEVLVAPTTSQPWMPLFATAAGLVTETGGVLCHAAVVAREYRLPAVVGVPAATRTLHEGQLVEVDGDRGLVRLLDRS